MSYFRRMISADLKKVKKNIYKRNKIIAEGNIKQHIHKTKKTFIPPYYIKFKYMIKDIKLSGKYLLRYNNMLNNKKYFNILYNNLIESDYYKYDFMIKQKLSKCGLNRTKQLYGTCWLDSLINGFIFGKRIRNRFLKLLDHYIRVNEITDIKKYIRDINKTKIKLSRKVDKDNMKIFLRFISILYSVLCEEGIRNETHSNSLTKHNNFLITNFAINVRNINIKKKSGDVLKGNNIAYNSYYALEYILYIFNKYIDTKPNLTYVENNGIKIYSMNNLYHINKLYFTINKREQYITPGSEYNINIKNINININIFNKRKFIFENGVIMDNIDNVDFLIFSCLDTKDPLYKKIPKEMELNINGKNYIFKLDYAGISIDILDEKIGHAITGIICDGSYYIYDPYNNYFKVDWTDLSPENIEHVIYYYKTIMADKFKKSYDSKTNKMILYNNNIETTVDMYIEYAVYYNIHNSFSYKMRGCDPSRPK